MVKQNGRFSASLVALKMAFLFSLKRDLSLLSHTLPPYMDKMQDIK